MKLSKTQQQQLNKAYHTLIQVCLYDTPIREMEPYLANDVMNFGAGRKELTKTKAAFLEQIKNQKKLARGLKMDFKINPVLRKITSNGNGAIFTDDIINTVWVNGVANKLQFRLSFIFEYSQNKWVLIHSHTSAPDSQRADDEVWPIEELRKRTAVLEKSLDEKVADLLIKNRELQIEAGLERIRAKAMTMQTSAGLIEVAVALREQMVVLGQPEIETSAVHLYEEDPDHILSWRAFRLGTKAKGKISMSHMAIPKKSCLLVRNWLKKFKSGLGSYTVEVSGAKQKEWYKVLFSLAPDIKAAMSGRRFESRYYHFSTFSGGALLMVSVKKPSDTSASLQRRAAGVFDLAYRRFLDLKKAEAQTREAKIEISLERVRSKTMAMHKSHDLAQVIMVLSQQLYLLGFRVDNAVFNTNYREKDWNLWMAYRDQPYPEQVHIPYFDHLFFNHVTDAVANEETIASSVMNKKDKDRFLDHLYGNSALAKFVPDEIKKLAYGKPGASWSVALLKFISVGVLNFDAVPYTDEQNSILKRFGSVFEQSYIRFLDLQKAEAQAEEARIETALEKVRSRSLAMHKSEELQEVVDTVFARLKELNFEVHAASIVIPSIEAEGALYWVATDALTYSNSIFVPSNFQGAIGQDVAAAFADGSNFFAKTYSYKEKNEMYQYLFENTDFGLIPEDRKRFILGSKAVTFSASIAGKIIIQLVRFNEVSFSEKENATLKRFARVFEQAYVRFLDLMKAEQQAEEARIETALEKVRSRSLAMHKSEELQEVVNTLFERMHELGIDNDSTNILLNPTEGSRDIDFWIANETHAFSTRVFVPHSDHLIINEALDARDSGKDLFSKTYTFEEKNKWFNYAFENSDLGHSPEERKQFILSSEAYTISVAFTKNAAVHLSRYSKKIFSERENDILKRFARVFEQAYVRFLDLKKAEEQAEEARIENGLEKVRSCSLAMHKSDELQEVVNTLFERLKELNIQMDSANIGIYTKGVKEFEYWIASPVQNRSASFYIPYADKSISRDIFLARESGKDLFAKCYSFEEKNDWFNYAFAETDFKYLTDDRKKFIMESEAVTFSMAFTKYSWLQVNRFSKNLLSDKENEILKRFARVFEQAYIRFLDLQKAEAQAREATIEASLERVRSRSMGMQKSEALREVIQLVFDQLLQLNIKADAAMFDPYFAESDDLNLWTAVAGGPYAVLQHVPYFDNSFFNPLRDAKAAGLDFFSQRHSFEEKNRFFEHFFQHVNVPEERRKHILSSAGLARSTVLLNSIMLSMQNYANIPYTDSENDILRRFGKVFEQSYTRFLDLQRAEEQVREATIEASLERVRSKTMAMHNSQDVGNTVATMFDELVKLGVETDRCGILIMNDAKQTEAWAAKAQASRQAALIIGRFDMTIHPMLQGVHAAWKNKESTFVYELLGEDVRTYYEAINAETDYPIRVDMNSLPSKQYHTDFYFAEGCIFAFTREPLQESASIVFKRFAGVFGQTYRRYLDLQKAESQAREAKIEAALERVRYRAMAMQNSEDVGAATSVMFNELDKLGIEIMRCGILFIDVSQTMEAWTSTFTEGKQEMSILGHLDMTIHPMLHEAYTAWSQKKESYTYHLVGKDVQDYYQSVKKADPVYSKLADDSMTMPDHFLNIYFFEEGGLYTFSLHQHTDEERPVMKKFTKVFSLTFRRYQDLKRAEEQVREATIEAALERVRYRAMAMQNSDDVWMATATMFTELDTLGIETLRCGILLGDGSETMDIWSVSKSANGKVIKGAGRIDMNTTPLWKALYETWRQKQDFLFYTLAGQEKDDYYKVIAGMNNYLTQPLEEMPDQFAQAYFFAEGSIWAFSKHPHSEADKNVLKKFTGVFALTFRRFQDLKKAEEQAREAKIEASLERVRSRTLAMQSSNELAETSVVVLQQLIGLGIQSNRLYIAIINDDDGRIEFWVTDEKGTQVSNKFSGNSNDNFSFKKMYDGWKEEKKSIVIDMQGKELEEYLQQLTTLGVPFNKDFQVRREHTIAYFSKGFMGLVSFEPQPKETTRLLERFAGVFNLTFTRYLDLKQAEEQAREAVIEAALEKVRGKAMAMHNSEDLATTIRIFYNELVRLSSATVIRVGAGLLNKENYICELTTVSKPAEGDLVEVQGKVDMAAYPIFKELYENWLIQKEFRYVLRGNEIKEYYQFLRGHVTIHDYPNDAVQYFYFPMFIEGSFYVVSETELTDHELQVFRRFISVFSLTYKRYKELKDAEGREKEAIRQASLDRVRAEIASMRTTDDLETITPLIWRELTTLGIPFIRCGVFIMDERKEICHAFLSTPEGKAIAAVEMPYSSGIIKDAIAPWRHKQVYTDHWDAKRFIEFWQEMTSMGANASQTQYQLQHPPDNLHRHFLPFLQGMLYAGNVAPLGEDDMSLLQSVADAFSTAYARYEDFNKLEFAKQQVENTLTDLKQAQTQLIQSEKMASLGELTAGIAHEIQNPLNFVNNFSEVSNELLDEMEAEIAKGNTEDAKAIAHDVKKNLEKILHHGKRADSIVKGMLQHSRSSSGVKEAVDINALADEYLRLAYHGLRAKDKSFNAAFKTDFDTSIGKVNVLQQDMGRVILNLLTNAFYAVTEKSKGMKPGEKYEPTVTVTTKKIGDRSDNFRVEIRVSDNGNGIPKKVQDKIFQPFFTTKPTGQGTGLGLSLSYDIVTKGHGGELRVETKEGEGSTFVIVLPMS